MALNKPIAIHQRFTKDKMVFSKLTLPWLKTHPDIYGGEPLNCIPAGIYTCVPYFSPSRKEDCWILQDVPGFTFIEIHKGNFGCDAWFKAIPTSSPKVVLRFFCEARKTSPSSDRASKLFCDNAMRSSSDRLFTSIYFPCIFLISSALCSGVSLICPPAWRILTEGVGFVLTSP